MYKAYKFRIYPNKAQQELLMTNFNACRYIYNRSLALKKFLYTKYKTNITGYDLIRRLTKLKKRHVWLQIADAQSLKQSILHLDEAYKNFFRNVIQGKKAGFPRFKSKHDSIYSAKYNQNIYVEPNKVRIPKLGYVKAVTHRDIKGKIKTITVSKTTTGKYFASVLCEDNTPIYKSTAQNILGIDLGISSIIVTSDGDKVDNPKFLEKARKKLVRRQRQLARKTKGSNRRRKAKILLAKAYEKLTNARNDWQHKLTRKIADENQAVIIETLSSKNMMQNRKLSKAIGDASWNSLITKLQYKLEKNGAQLIKINRFYPSSKTCSCCGNIKKELKLSERMYACQACGHTQDRDINASINLRNEGIRIMAESKPATARGGDRNSLTTPIFVVKVGADEPRNHALLG